MRVSTESATERTARLAADREALARVSAAVFAARRAGISRSEIRYSFSEALRRADGRIRAERRTPSIA